MHHHKKTPLTCSRSIRNSKKIACGRDQSTQARMLYLPAVAMCLGGLPENQSRSSRVQPQARYDHVSCMTSLKGSATEQWQQRCRRQKAVLAKLRQVQPAWTASTGTLDISGCTCTRCRRVDDRMMNRSHEGRLEKHNRSHCLGSRGACSEPLVLL